MGQKGIISLKTNQFLWVHSIFFPPWDLKVSMKTAKFHGAGNFMVGDIPSGLLVKKSTGYLATLA